MAADAFVIILSRRVFRLQWCVLYRCRNIRFCEDWAHFYELVSSFGYPRWRRVRPPSSRHSVRLWYQKHFSHKVWWRPAVGWEMASVLRNSRWRWPSLSVKPPIRELNSQFWAINQLCKFSWRIFTSKSSLEALMFGSSLMLHVKWHCPKESHISVVFELGDGVSL